MNLQANYPIPAKLIYPTPESIYKTRQLGDGNMIDHSRTDLYRIFEKMIGAWNRNSRACMLRTICEVADTPLKHNGLLGELIDIVFTPSENDPMDEEFKTAAKYGKNGVDFCVTVGISATTCGISNSTTCTTVEALNSRQKRWLSFLPNGGLVKVVFSFVAPVKFYHRLKRSINAAINLQANYPIPARIIYPTPGSIYKNRQLTDGNIVDNSRTDLYRIIEKMIGAWGRNSRECLLRTICEVADTPLKHNGLVGELIDIVFTPSESDQMDEEFKTASKYGKHGVDCTRLYPKCPSGHGILEKISAVINI
ncbi:uncharacterized protein LOC128739787 [Sabethes cyaneus]|uniref:uncharacterized protein LOC128739787 n=1 Tax=Sabethes cyaneus TaxID=53552 RepID=UPI00237EE97F|nr:uncharacterized protein LOC128739787 [Sabethes cyaneus]